MSATEAANRASVEAVIQEAIDEWATTQGGPKPDDGVTLARYIRAKLEAEDASLLDVVDGLVKALIVCKPYLDVPFPDRPTLTPWTVSCERPFKTAARVRESKRPGARHLVSRDLLADLVELAKDARRDV